MTVAQQRLTLADYLAYEAPTETRYELVNGELIEIPAESDILNLWVNHPVLL